MRANAPSVVICTLVLLAPLSADARMYQWVSPSSSTPQLSGEPPPWYRGDQGGPRIRVFENGNLVDDTAIALPATQREELRTEAFQEAEDRRRADALKRLEQAARREERRLAEMERLAEVRVRQEGARQSGPAVVAVPVTPAVSAVGTALPAPGDVLNEDAVAQLKAIIADFDRQGGARNRRGDARRSR